MEKKLENVWRDSLANKLTNLYKRVFHWVKGSIPVLATQQQNRLGEQDELGGWTGCSSVFM